MTVAAFIVAALGLLVAALALGWQIAAWLYDGRRVRVSLVHGAISSSLAVTGKVERDRQPRDLSSSYIPGFVGREVIGIAVTNVGRAPVRIDRCTVVPRIGALSFTAHGNIVGPDLPYRLPPGETETWFVDATDVRALITSNAGTNRRASRDVAMTVVLGTGDSRRTRRTVILV